jgi:hypothetical protein
MGKADLKEHAEHESGSEVQEGKKSESWSCQQQQQQDGVMACSRPVGMFSILIRLGVALCYRLHLCTLSCSITIKKKKVSGSGRASSCTEGSRDFWEL